MRRGILILALFASSCLFSSSGGVDKTDSDMGDGTDAGFDASMADSEQRDGTVEETCGDGLLQPDEACDPMLPMDSPGSCPTSCDDDEACTIDELVGSPEQCDAACRVTVIEVCENNDGCCPSACTAETDTDCDDSAVCGDGVLAPAESCDPGITSGDGSCPTIDDCPVNVCAVPRVAGSRANCDAACVDIPIESCTDGDGCCPPGCATTNDSDCVAACPNGVVDAGERCDGNCPELAACDDGNACTEDTLQGSAGTCDARCVNAPVTACMDDDGCCPSACNSTNDNDCSMTCGNMTVDAGETCDDSSPTPADACPDTCDDQDACTEDISTGSAANCNRVCGNNPIDACVSADGCCPNNGLCNANNDTDCSPVCGNGAIESGEHCDGNCPTACDDGVMCTTDALVGSADDCSARCVYTNVTMCMGGDGCCPANCNANNDSDCGPQCGNGVIESGESCDGNCPQTCNDGDVCTFDGASGNPAQCNRVCSNQPITMCAGGDGCCPTGCTSGNDSDCMAGCGNGVVDDGETCDGNCPTAEMCQTMGACHALTGSGCNIQCLPTPGCQTCTVNGSCTCTDRQACIGGKCVDTPNGGQCGQACDQQEYCDSFSSNTQCDGQTGLCVECLTTADCGYDEECNFGYCEYADDCDDAANPTQYCADLGYPACNFSTGDCWDACMDGDPNACEATETCVGGFCMEAMSCGEARDDDAWCAQYGTGLVCIDDECENACNPVVQNCDCPEPTQQRCRQHISGKNYCSGPPPQTCQEVCPAARAEYCENRQPGSVCGLPSAQNPDGCVVVPMDPDPDMGGDMGPPDMGPPDMGPPDLGGDMNAPDIGNPI